MNRTLIVFLILICQNATSQTFSTNLTPVGWEHNVLFNATTRYTVTQQGPAQNLTMMFDGSMNPNYIAGVSAANPSEILIDGLPAYHTQSGAWVGWTTRYLPANKFKIEGYDTYNSANVWRVIADYSTINYSGLSFSVKIPTAGVYTKLKFTFYEGQDGNVGLSELFFIHPEATTPYAGLLSQALNNWQKIGANIAFSSGNVGIGTLAPDEKLTVKGKIHTQEVRVDMAGPLVPDYVFAEDYNLRTLEELDEYIKQNKHLPEIPSAQEIEKNGLMLAKMNIDLLKKIEELTLYSIQQNREIQILKNDNLNYKSLSDKLELLQKEMSYLKTKTSTKN